MWPALLRYVDGLVRGAARSPLTLLLGTEPRGGFAVAEERPPERLTLAGRHRFSRYRLAFVLDDAPGGGTRLRALTFAAFPGPHGRVYRALVIGTRLHAVAMTRMLRAVRRECRG